MISNEVALIDSTLMLSIGGPICTSLARTVAGIRRRSPQTTMKCTRYLIDHLIISLTIPKSTCPTQLIDTWGCRRWCHQGLVGGKSGRCTIYVFWWCALVVHRDKTQVISRGANDSRALNRGASPDIRHPTSDMSTIDTTCPLSMSKHEVIIFRYISKQNIFPCVIRTDCHVSFIHIIQMQI